MAISIDATSGGITSGTQTSLTVSHTCSGSDRILITQIETEPAGRTTGVTYNGVSMTLLQNTSIIAGAVELLTYYLLAPATGANNIVVSFSSATNGHVWSASYTGVKQSGFPDSQANSGELSGGTTQSQATTVVDSNCWLVGLGYNDVAEIFAGAGTTRRAVCVAGVNYALFDSNGTVSTGSQSLATSWTGTATSKLLYVLSMSPATGNNSNFFMFM